MSASFRASRGTRVSVPFWLLILISPAIVAIWLIWIAVNLVIWLIGALAARGARG